MNQRPTAQSAPQSRLRRAFAFPNPVNEYAARSTAALVVAFALVIFVLTFFGGGWLLLVLALGFWLRVAGGPRYSPFGRLAVHLIAPRLGAPRLVPGPPKRFAQTIGALLSTTAAVFWFLGLTPVALVLLALLIAAASLEAFAGFCLGCWIFARLQAVGWIPESVCEACNNIALRRPGL